MLSRLSVMKTHTGNTFQHLRARGWIPASWYVLETVFFRARIRGLVLLVRSTVSFASPRLTPPFHRGCPMPSTRYEACLITRSVHAPIELPSCRRSPSPLSRSVHRLTLFRSRLPASLVARSSASVLDPFLRIRSSLARRSSSILSLSRLGETVRNVDRNSRDVNSIRGRNEYIILLPRKRETFEKRQKRVQIGSYTKECR